MKTPMSVLNKSITFPKCGSNTSYSNKIYTLSLNITPLHLIKDGCEIKLQFCSEQFFRNVCTSMHSSVCKDGDFEGPTSSSQESSLFVYMQVVTKMMLMSLRYILHMFLKLLMRAATTRKCLFTIFTYKHCEKDHETAGEMQGVLIVLLVFVFSFVWIFVSYT